VKVAGFELLDPCPELSVCSIPSFRVRIDLSIASGLVDQIGQEEGLSARGQGPNARGDSVLRLDEVGKQWRRHVPPGLSTHAPTLTRDRRRTPARQSAGTMETKVYQSCSLSNSSVRDDPGRGRTTREFSIIPRAVPETSE
jgi:hypothetical protein